MLLARYLFEENEPVIDIITLTKSHTIFSILKYLIGDY